MRILLIVFILLTNYTYAQLPKMENGKLMLENPVTFKTGSAELTDDGKEALKPVKEFLQQKTYVTMMRVEGHTDNLAEETTNQKLSEQRALAICKWLVENGIDCKRLIAVGFGSTKPIASNDDPTGKAQNRRMEFIPARLNGKAIGGNPVDGGGVIAGDPCPVVKIQ
jgi:OOP family OmpA-OmpF porin